jgi:hypothetical protein
MGMRKLARRNINRWRESDRGKAKTWRNPMKGKQREVRNEEMRKSIKKE